MLKLVLYLDAKSAFDKVLKYHLIRQLYFAGTRGQELLLLNHRMESRTTFPESDKELMGPLDDEQGVGQGARTAQINTKSLGNPS